MKVLLYYIGKARDTHANAMAEEYIKRSTRFAKCEMREIHPLRFDPVGEAPGGCEDSTRSGGAGAGFGGVHCAG